MRKEPWNLKLQTLSGYWKEKEDDFTAIRNDGKGLFSPFYEGVRRTLEFYEHSGTKTDWVIHEYQLLCPHKNYKSALFFEVPTNIAAYALLFFLYYYHPNNNFEVLPSQA